MSYKPTRVGERGVMTELYAAEAAALPKGYMARGGRVPDALTRSTPGPARRFVRKAPPAIGLRVTSGPISTPAQLTHAMDPRLKARHLERTRSSLSPTVSERSETIDAVYGGTPKIIALPPPALPARAIPLTTDPSAPWTQRVKTAPAPASTFLAPIPGIILPPAEPAPSRKHFPTALVAGAAAGATLLYFLFRR